MSGDVDSDFSYLSVLENTGVDVENALLALPVPQLQTTSGLEPNNYVNIR